MRKRARMFEKKTRVRRVEHFLPVCRRAFLYTLASLFAHGSGLLTEPPPSVALPAWLTSRTTLCRPHGTFPPVCPSPPSRQSRQSGSVWLYLQPRRHLALPHSHLKRMSNQPAVSHLPTVSQIGGLRYAISPPPVTKPSVPPHPLL